jgi:sugar lactone lactonase YvrE
MKNYFSILLAVLAYFGFATFTASAHPGSGISVDDQGRVYFSEAGDIDARLPGAIWQIDPQGKLTRLHEGGAHYLTLDANRSFAQTNLTRWFGERLTPWLQRVDTSDAALIQADGQPIVMHRDGSLYSAKGNLEISRLTPDGRSTPIAPSLATDRLGGIKGLAFGPDDSLYVACPSAILKVGTNGTVSTLIQSIAVPDCDPEFPPNMPESQSPFLRGLAVDARGTVYAAATGCRAVLMVTSNGQMSVVLRAERPWSPTGIAVHGEEVYVVEYQHPHSAKREEWVPRVRKLARDGKVTALATLPTAQSRRVTPQRSP